MLPLPLPHHSPRSSCRVWGTMGSANQSSLNCRQPTTFAREVLEGGEGRGGGEGREGGEGRRRGEGERHNQSKVCRTGLQLTYISSALHLWYLSHFCMCVCVHIVHVRLCAHMMHMCMYVCVRCMCVHVHAMHAMHVCVCVCVCVCTVHVICTLRLTGCSSCEVVR